MEQNMTYLFQWCLEFIKEKKEKEKKKKKSFLSNGPKKIPTILLKLQKAVCKYCTFETNPIGNEIYLIDKPQHYFLGVN